MLTMMSERTDVDWSLVRWWLCTNCCWVGMAHDQGDKRCQRPSGEYNNYTGGPFELMHWTGPCPTDAIQMQLPQMLNDTLWSALRIGGTNAILDILNEWSPEMLGLRSQVEARREKP